ncbi:hypothetical protein OG897_34920 [Streptomyces sp. NBC_00237]|uniref:hypothetical protein n=1 Tax=Streptomyces sp. NBC_00237 TaxID=2975687 RepID=UPI00224CF158|nr:hypothetical protein [Streptomyces sp. NBC_00237]MCX5206585.1 hypothetical protein [Streptomyces sp. NBC_00237]
MITYPSPRPSLSAVSRSTPAPNWSRYSASHGYPPLSLTEEPTLRAASGSVLYLVLVGLLSLGVALLVRSSAAAVGVVLGLFFFFPILAQVIADPDWQRLLQQAAPMPAGLNVQTTGRRRGTPDRPVGGARRARLVGPRRAGGGRDLAEDA